MQSCLPLKIMAPHCFSQGHDYYQGTCFMGRCHSAVITRSLTCSASRWYTNHIEGQKVLLPN